ncbi:MAG: tungstate transport system substrate-binding protein [Hyphomicrobiaceae bacterium]|jgi:tungstate transport system substrate-binding protein
MTFIRALATSAIIAAAITTTLVAIASANDRSIIVQSTTSTKNSGLYNVLLPQFKKATGITVHIVAVGTGQAIRNARNCDGDVLLVHAKGAEQKFVTDGFGTKRHDLMYNDFVFVGPPSDSAKITGSKSASDTLKKIATSKAIFASRGDDSGTHKKERTLWQAAGIDPTPSSGKWYRETGSGMGATLNIAVGMGAYAMTDRATWIAFKNKRDFKVLVEGDKALFNQYGITAVSAKKCPSVKTKLAETFSAWLRSKSGQSAIAAYKRNGQQLFFPNAVTN